ncbi:maleylacetoacetate isomerase, partial [Escherichia coli]
MILHGYWRSGASYRVRIALNLKGITYDNAAHDLRKGEQKAADYVALNPQ